mgnify:CR=1 FL=1
MLISLILGLIWYQLIAHIGISAGLHRYWSHRAFTAGPIYETVSLYMGVIAGSLSPLGWVAAHRMHHAYGDSESDPHSPNFKGFWNVVLSNWDIERIPRKFAKDLYNNPRIKFFHRHWKIIWGVSAIISVLIGIEFFIGFIVVPFLIARFGFGFENALTHKTGRPKDIPWLNLITAGEGYHKQHHDGKQLRFHKYDLTGFVLEKIYK